MSGLLLSTGRAIRRVKRGHCLPTCRLGFRDVVRGKSTMADKNTLKNGVNYLPCRPGSTRRRSREVALRQHRDADRPAGAAAQGSSGSISRSLSSSFTNLVLIEQAEDRAALIGSQVLGHPSDKTDFGTAIPAIHLRITNCHLSSTTCGFSGLNRRSAFQLHAVVRPASPRPVPQTVYHGG